MKKTMLIAAMATFCAFATVLYSCSKKEDTAVKPLIASNGKTNSTNRIVHTTTSDTLTQESHAMGLTGVTLNTANSTGYEFTLSANMITFNGVDFTLNGQHVKLSEIGTVTKMQFGNNYQSELYFDSTTNEVSFYVGGQIHTLADWHNGVVTLSKIDEDELSWGLVIFDEFVNNQTYRQSLGGTGNKHGLWMTVNGGISRELSEWRTQHEVGIFLNNNPGCVQIGGLSTSCLWDNHFCMTTAHYNCV